MAAPKRSKAQREEDLARMAEMLAKGVTERDLAAEFQLSPSTVHRDVATIEERWRSHALQQADLHKGRILAGHDQVIKEAWSEFDRSKGDAEKMVEVTEMLKDQPAKPDGDVLAAESPYPLVLEVTRRTLTVEGQTGDPRYLTVIENALEAKAKLLGVNAPERHQVTGKDGGPVRLDVRDLSSLTDTELALLETVATKIESSKVKT